MSVGGLALAELEARLAGVAGLPVRFGPFNVNIRSDLPGFVRLAHWLYQPYPLAPPQAVADFHVQIARPRGLRRWWRRQACFSVDGRSPFSPFPEAHALAGLEWGINWCVATRAHHLLMLHAAAVERGGGAMLLPAWPGRGKSTLCAALVHSGWRLLSDEFGLVRPADGLLLPLPRPIPLKNQSIDVIARFCPEAAIGPSMFGTRKGTVAHLRPPAGSVLRAGEPARPRWLVFPRWMAGAKLGLAPMPRSQAFLMVATNSFNYEFLDATAYRLVGEMVDACECYALVYSDLAEAVAALGELAGAGHG